MDVGNFKEMLIGMAIAFFNLRGKIGVLIDLLLCLMEEIHLENMFAILVIILFVSIQHISL